MACLWRVFRTVEQNYLVSVINSKLIHYSSGRSSIFNNLCTSWDSNVLLNLSRYCCMQCVKFSSTDSSVQKSFKTSINSGPDLKHFIALSNEGEIAAPLIYDHPPYVETNAISGIGRKVFYETYGCQMNVNDTEVVLSILQKHGFERADDIFDSDIILIMTCAIREGAEQKIWNRLKMLRKMKRKREPDRPSLKIGILGCMAERLKHKLIETEKIVDLVAGPDSYKDLPNLLSATESQEAAINVMLSYDETYADVMPVRLNPNSPTAFVSIMRGCDNMCSYCIVPFTRGRERSRPINSILMEVEKIRDQGVKQVTLLGQNVNSYCDRSEQMHHMAIDNAAAHMSKGFKTIYKPKVGGHRFADLLDQVSQIDPELRIRFTSPHPKDFPDEVLQLVHERANICKQIHLPAQCGNDRMLQRMKRGHTREAYLELVSHIRQLIPDVSLSSDFICGFCGETEDEFEDTLSLVREVKYNYMFTFAYSMREKTHAHRTYRDNVPQNVKVDRLTRLIKVFREEAHKLNQKYVGSLQTVLLESKSKRSDLDFVGRNDGNTSVIIPAVEIPTEHGSNIQRPMTVGDYITVEVTEANSQILKGVPLCHTTLRNSSKSFS